MLCLILLSDHCFAQRDCVNNMALQSYCCFVTALISTLKSLKEKDKSEMEMLQIDWAGGQNEEAHTEL